MELEIKSKLKSHNRIYEQIILSSMLRDDRHGITRSRKQLLTMRILLIRMLKTYERVCIYF